MGAAGSRNTGTAHSRPDDAAAEAVAQEGSAVSDRVGGRLLDEDSRSGSEEPREGRNGDAVPANSENLTDALEQLSRRIEAAEHRATLAITGIDQSVLGVISRLQSAEVAQSEQAGRYQGALENLERTQAAITEQIARLEGDDAEQRNLEALKSLEAALAKVANQVNESEAGAEAKMAALQNGIASIADDVERAASELSRTVDEHAAQTGLQLRRMREELEGELAGKIEQIGDAASARIETLDAKLETSLDAAQSGAAAVAENAAREAAQRTEHVEARLAETEAMVQRASETAKARDEALAESTARQISQRAEQLETRLADAEAIIQKAADAAEARDAAQMRARREELKEIESAVVKIRERLSAAEGVTDEALRALETSFIELDGRMRATETSLADIPARLERAKEEAAAARKDAAGAIKNSESARLDAAEAVRRAEERAEAAVEEGARRVLEATRDVKAHLDDALSTAREDVQTALSDAQAAHAEVERARQEAADARVATDEARREALEAVEQAEARFADRFESLGRRLAEMVAESRVEIAQHLDSVSGDLNADELRQRIDEVAERVETSERRSAKTLERIGEEIAKMATVVDARLTDSERRAARLARASSDSAGGVSDEAIEARLREIESQSANAVARVGEEMARVAERMEDQLRSAEQRSDEAIETVSEDVRKLMRHVETGGLGGAPDPALSRRILEESEERTRVMVEEAMSSIHRRLDDAYEQTSSPNSPIQRALSDLSLRLEQIEKHPADPHRGPGETDFALEPPPYDAEGFDDPLTDVLAAEEIEAISATLEDHAAPLLDRPTDLEDDEPYESRAERDRLAGLDGDDDLGFSHALEERRDFDRDDPDQDDEFRIDDGEFRSDADDSEFRVSDDEFGAGGDEFRIDDNDDDAPPIAPLDSELDEFEDDDLAYARRSDYDADDERDLVAPAESSEPGFGPARTPERRARKPRRVAATVGLVAFLGVAAVGVTLVFDAGRRRAALQEEAARDPILDRLAAQEEAESPLLSTPEPMTPAPSTPALAEPGPYAGADALSPDELTAAGITPPAGVEDLAGPVETVEASVVDEALVADIAAPAPPADDVETAVVDATPAEPALPEPASLTDSNPTPGPTDETAPAEAPQAATPEPETPAATEAPQLAEIEPEPILLAEAPIAEATPAAIAPGEAPATSLSPPTLEEAAEAGDPIAQFQLADAALAAGAVDAGARMMRQAAENGLPVAQYQLAKLYEQGRGVPRDFGQARVWTERAASAGNIKAMHNLGIFFAEGRGAELDFGQAARWFEEAALLGAQDSQHNLAVLYEQGLGVTLSLPDAYAWYQIAGRQGDRQSADRAAALAPRLTQEARARADEAVVRFQPRAVDEQANGVFWDLPVAQGASVVPAPAPGPVASSAVADDADIVIATARAQMLLTELGYEPGPPDGMMGPRTADAIRAFQRSRGLAATGVVDTNLITQLEAETRR